MEAVTVGTGLTNTMRFTGAPAHPALCGVILYTIDAVLFVVFTGVSVTELLPVGLTPVNVPVTLDVHVYVVPEIDEVGKKLSAVPLQISSISEAGDVVITGLGFTVIVTSSVLPLHPLAAGVIL